MRWSVPRHISHATQWEQTLALRAGVPRARDLALTFHFISQPANPFLSPQVICNEHQHWCWCSSNCRNICNSDKYFLTFIIVEKSSIRVTWGYLLSVLPQYCDRRTSGNVSKVFQKCIMERGKCLWCLMYNFVNCVWNEIYIRQNEKIAEAPFGPETDERISSSIPVWRSDDQ